ncbi:MAG TPA: nucleotidyltransferase domain-containing protein [Phycisphaerales bacterium]|mgnify:CR=1 FL=1|nr:nucleotidyltransferase domain-containing protein [Phycisphaerales bacterium]
MRVDLSSIEQVLQGDARIVSAYVLGSAAEGRMRADSDVDIAILPVAGRGFSPVDILELSAKFSLAAGRTVDLGMLSSRNLIYASQVLRRSSMSMRPDDIALNKGGIRQRDTSGAGG